jgi:hypothetical protein
LQQSLFKAIKFEDSLPFPYWREAIQMPPPRLWKSLQCAQQHEATRERLPYFRRRCNGIKDLCSRLGYERFYCIKFGFSSFLLLLERHLAFISVTMVP